MKKLGFTLIELLAVILILGIIALIAIPTVNNIIKESKKGAFKTSAQNIVSSIEQKCRMQQLKGEEITKYYRFEDGISLTDAGFKGEVPTDGSVVVDDECNIDIVVSKENYIAVKTKEEDRVTVIEDKYYTPGTPVVYNPGEANYTNWYVLKDNGETVTLLLNRNLKTMVNSLVDWVNKTDYVEAAGHPVESSYYNENLTDYGPVTVMKKFNEWTNSWNEEAKSKIRMISVTDILEVLGKNDWNGENIYFDTKTSEAPTITEGYVSKYAWLFNNIMDCNHYGCTDFTIAAPNGYWTSDKINKKGAYSITWNGELNDEPFWRETEGIDGVGYFGAGIRPVITIPKSSIQ